MTARIYQLTFALLLVISASAFALSYTAVRQLAIDNGWHPKGAAWNI